MSANTITLAITGASGLPYGLRLLECLLAANKIVYLLFSPAAHVVAVHELDFKLPKQTSALKNFFVEKYQATAEQLFVFDQNEWTAPIASGSNVPYAMVICPCSSGTLAAVANGMSNNLIERAADVILKENKQLIVVPRETPLSKIQIENLLKLASMNVTIMPASPGFYHKPTGINDLVDFMVARLLDHLAIPHSLTVRWGSSEL